MNIVPITTTLAVDEKLAWLGSRHGIESADTIELDGAAFNAIYTDGVAKSGTIMGKITATGRYAPYNSGASDGSQTAVGVLAKTVRTLEGTTVVNSPAPLMTHGKVITNNLPRGASAVGGYAAAVKTALPTIIFN